MDLNGIAGIINPNFKGKIKWNWDLNKINNWIYSRTD